MADDEPELVIDRRIFQLVFQPLSVCIDVHDLDYKPMGSLLLRFEGGVVQKFDIILNMLMRKQHFDPSLLAHRFPLAPESAFGKYGKQVSSEARGSAKSVESCMHRRLQLHRTRRLRDRPCRAVGLSPEAPGWRQLI